MSEGKEKKNQDICNEYELTKVTEWPESEWKKDYPEVAGFISEFLNSEKQMRLELLPLIQLLTPTPVHERIYHLSTDGEHLYYCPALIKEKLEIHSDNVVRYVLSRQLMHILMHGFLGHFGSYYEDEELAWAIQDLLAERFSATYQCPLWYDDDDDDEYGEFGDEPGDIPYFGQEEESYFGNQKKLDELLEKGMGAYHFIKPKKKSRQFVIDQAWAKKNDNHKLWNQENSSRWEQATQDIMSFLPPELMEQLRKLSKQAQEMLKDLPMMEVDSRQIKSISLMPASKRNSLDIMNLDLSSIGMLITSVSMSGGEGYGLGAGGVGMTVTAKKDSTRNYTDVLRELCMEKERVHDDPDSIDPMYYQYGMELYENMPLIESLEENFDPSIENIVFAIDTSGSCGGSIAQRFIDETCKILSDADGLGHVGSVTMLQCDAQIQKVQEFENGKEMLRHLDGSVELGGFGGTSFVPVFDWIEEKRLKTGENTTALIYLTDGMGEYPQKKPEYPTYFVLPHESEWMRTEIKDKPWIQLVILDS